MIQSVAALAEYRSAWKLVLDKRFALYYTGK
jgi:hypothetical protein